MDVILSDLTRERVRSTFMEDFRAFMEESVPENRREFDWHDPTYDPAGRYVIDCKINSMPKPLFIQALPNDDKTRDATITLFSLKSGDCPSVQWLFLKIRSKLTVKCLPDSAMFPKSSSPASV
jgi:hypothetical protein